MDDTKKTPMLDERPTRDPHRLDVEREDRGNDGIEQAENEIEETDTQR